MSAMNKTTLLFIRKALEQCNTCPGFYGAVLSSPDGLVLSSSGQFDGDESAACASGLIIQTTSSLNQLSAKGPTEILIWGADNKIWNVTVLTGDYILLIAATEVKNIDMLRRLMHRTADMLNQALKLLV